MSKDTAAQQPGAGHGNQAERGRHPEAHRQGGRQKAGRSPSEVTLVAVTKTVDASAIQEAFAAGLRHFGESRIQEAKDKIPSLSCLDPRPIWHLVGHLQTNKAKTAAEMFGMSFTALIR